KIVGIAMVGLTQFLLWIAITSVLSSVGLGMAKDRMTDLATSQMPGQATVQLQQEIGTTPGQADADEDARDMRMAFELWEELPIARIVGLFLFYFLGGYLLYSSLLAAIGAAVDAESDTQQFMFPITIPLMIGIFIAQTAVYNPDGPAVFWSSIIPFTSPVVMMIRVATGNAFEHPGQLVLSMVLLVGTFIFTTWLAGRIYRTGILMYGKKVSWKELGRWLFYRG
ncbi:MAG TPA: ABC transporter permease, partial [Flavobacteriales bacterium]|nr:ABC transporter permease [Flavobacteriales bacterium]